jgi:ABC-2 type transport system permease protein
MTLISERAVALARKELYSHGNSPAFYGTAVFFLLFTSIWLFYIQRFFTQDQASLRVYFAAFPLAFILVIPAITMKSWAEERKLGSVEILLTMPFSEWELALGKYLSAMGALVFIIALTLPLPLSLLSLGAFDGGVIVAEYVGALLLGSTAVALGLFLSALSKNQAGAFLGGAVALMATMLAQQVTFGFELPPALVEAINFISLAFHFESFTKGLIDSRDLVFFVVATALFLFLNTRVILYRKWR